MIDRRAFLGIAAAAPFIPKLDEPDIRVDNLDLEQGVRLHSISPDGETLLGTRDDERLCFFEADTLKEISASEASRFVQTMYPYSMRWSPDGSRIAFSTLSHGLEDMAEVLVVDVDTGIISGLDTQAGTPVATPISADGTSIEDAFPMWLDDETLIFVRQKWSSDVISSVLMSVNPGQDEPAVWNDLQGLDVALIYGFPHMRTDGRVAFLANPSNTSSLASAEKQTVRMFIAGPGEATEQFALNGVMFADLIDTDDTHAVILDVGNFEAFRISLDDPTTHEATEDLFALEEGVHPVSYPAIGPTPGSLVIALANVNRSVIVLGGNGVRELAYLRGPESNSLFCTWVEGKILITGEVASWLLEVDDL